MNKSLRSLAILLALVITGLCFSFRIPIRAANATYVWGPIDKDTIWTLVDSPFVVSGDITIYPNATLTVEPAVEVKFGGNFSIFVEGTLKAESTGTANIKFTSNSLNPKPGDWGAIRLTSTRSAASLSNCLIEYGTNGIVASAGTLTVTNCQVRSNSQNGIKVLDGTLDAENNNVEGNLASGINIDGNNQVLIHNNNLTSNGDGIKVARSINSQVDIQQNNFYNNTHSGILLTADSYDHTQILDNVFSANNYGFDVSTDASTTIFHNYIFNNTVGIFYENGVFHQAHFNDIYNNTKGMDISGNVYVSAANNYWGDRTGPRQDKLNPHGKGNPVGGNDTNLNFIFFLTHPFEYNNNAPTADLQTDMTLVAPNQKVTFIGTTSTDDGQVDQYYFDFGDGTNTNWITLSLFNHTYALPGTYVPSLKVMDDFNVMSQNTATTSITVQQNLTPLNVAITLSNETANFNENVSATVYVSTAAGPLADANVRLLAVTGGSFTPVSGLTDSNGYFTTIFTAPKVTEVTNIRIIAAASMSGYADGSNYEYLKVLPPLIIQVNANPAMINSQDASSIEVTVTDSFGEPVSNVDLALSLDGGNLSATSAITDLNGKAAFTFNAPVTLSQINVTITVMGSKAEYASEQSQQVIIINPKLLILALTAYPTEIFSETTSTLTAHVAYGTSDMPDAILTASSNTGGSFQWTTNVTNSNGNTVIVFTAPPITALDGANATVTVTAHKDGYVDAQNQAIITIKPRILNVQVTAQPDQLTSEAKANITVHVTSSYDTNPVQDANITILSDSGGTFNTTTGLTDRNGDLTFPFTAPLAASPLNATISALSSKTGYASGQNSTSVTVNPGNLTVQIKTSSETVTSTETGVVEVTVLSNSTPVANVSVTMATNFGNFSTTTSVTDSNGRCTFLFNAPKTDVQFTATIRANATKNGYMSAAGQTMINVIPEMTTQTVGGIPLTIILLIVIPAIIVAVVAVLIKFKVISISFGEEEQ